MRAIALIGNPNCGKTTLLNVLTGARLRVGNWPGVTVERKQAPLELGAEVAMLNDLPGVYSLAAYGMEERVALSYLTSGEPQLVLNVLDATNLERNLYLTLALMELGIPMVVALSQMDALEGGGGSLDAGALSRMLGMAVVPVSPIERRGLPALMQALAAALAKPAQEPPKQHTPALQAREFSEVCAERYQRIESMLRAAHYRPPKAQEHRWDALFLHPVWAYPLFWALMALCFWCTFGPIGGFATRMCEQLVALGAVAAARALAGAPPLLRSLMLDGALAGVGGVLCFLPQILMLFLFLSALEDSGYMARAAFLADRPLKALGLSGRAFIPLLMGFGCTTTAVVAARSVDSERDRSTTILLLPFMSCGAKLPVYALFGAAFFAGQQGALVLFLYMLGMLMMALCGALLKRVRSADEAPFVLELPPYRRPQWREVWRRLMQRARDFVVRAGTLIFLVSLVIWFLTSFAPDLQWAQSGRESLFGRLGAWLSPLFGPLGFSDWRQCVALLSGLVAKEAVVSTLQVLCHATDAAGLSVALPQLFTGASAASFLVFTLLYPPCLSALAAMRRELRSTRLLLLSIGIQFSAAYLAALVVYRVLILFS